MARSGAAHLVDGLEAVRTGVEALHPPDLTAHCTARYELAGAVEELRAFVADGERVRLRNLRERFARMLVMLSQPDRQALTLAAGEVLRAAEELTPEERRQLAAHWDDLDATARATELAREAVALEDLPARPPEPVPRDEFELIRRVMTQLPAGLERWTWETPSATRRGEGRHWHVDNEVHVQNLLWLALRPALPELCFEETLPSIGRKRPRVDLAFPRLQLVIEVKFIKARRDFNRVIDEIAADSNLYTAAEASTYSRLMVFVWDDTRSSELHDQLARGLKTFRGVVEAVVMSRPGRMTPTG